MGNYVFLFLKKSPNGMLDGKVKIESLGAFG